MAEILFLQRGNHRAVDDFERFADGTLLPYERTFHDEVIDPKTKKKKKVDKKVKYGLQIGRREYKIVGLAVPDEQVDRVLNALEIGDGDVHPAQAKIMTTALRKMMGAEKIPKQKDRKPETMPFPRQGVAIYMIGIKRDKTETWIDPTTGKAFTQENI